MADLQALAEQIADAINTVPEQNATAGIPDNINTPMVTVEPDLVDWTSGTYGRGFEPWSFLVRVLLGIGLNSETQKARNEYLGGSRDIKDAIEANVPSSFVSSARKFDAWTYANVEYLGVEFVVDVIA